MTTCWSPPVWTSGAAIVGREIGGGPEPGFGETAGGAGFFDSGVGQAEVEVVLDGAVDEGIQERVVKVGPPEGEGGLHGGGEAALGGGLSGCADPALRHWGVGAVEVGADEAAGKEGKGEEEEGGEDIF